MTNNISVTMRGRGLVTTEHLAYRKPLLWVEWSRDRCCHVTQNGQGHGHRLTLSDQTGHNSVAKFVLVVQQLRL